jgi:hypothetical protein
LHNFTGTQIFQYKRKINAYLSKIKNLDFLMIIHFCDAPIFIILFYVLGHLPHSHPLRIVIPTFIKDLTNLITNILNNKQLNKILETFINKIYKCQKFFSLQNHADWTLEIIWCIKYKIAVMQYTTQSDEKN